MLPENNEEEQLGPTARYVKCAVKDCDSRIMHVGLMDSNDMAKTIQEPIRLRCENCHLESYSRLAFEEEIAVRYELESGSLDRAKCRKNQKRIEKYIESMPDRPELKNGWLKEIPGYLLINELGYGFDSTEVNLAQDIVNGDILRADKINRMTKHLANLAYGSCEKNTS